MCQICAVSQRGESAFCAWLSVHIVKGLDGEIPYCSRVFVYNETSVTKKSPEQTR